MLEEELKRGFICINCRKWVTVHRFKGSPNKNHCPYCLWSKHVDKTVAGDRLSGCKGGMMPIGLTLKKKRVNKWGREVTGEVMIVHECIRCRKISINRVLAEDNTKEVMNLLQVGSEMNEDKKSALQNGNINILTEKDEETVKTKIFGNEG